MANRGIWSLFGSNPTTVLNPGTTLATATMSVASSTYANQTNLDLYCDIEFYSGSTFSPSATPAFVAVYVLVAVDGTNFPAQSDADLRLTSTQLFCVIPIGTTAATAQRVAARNILLPPQPIQFKLDNQTGATIPSSWTLKIDAYSYNLNG
jgi:hypothetical protein